MKLFYGILFFMTTTCFAQIDSVATIQKGDSIVYDLVAIQQQPEYPGGDGELFSFLRKNINYPIKERDNGIQGKVFITFIIDKDGSVTDVALYKGLIGGPGCDKEAMRVIKMMPKWQPGMQNGKTVKVRYILPIMFKLGTANDFQGPDLQQATYYYNKGVKKFEDGKYEDAINLFDKALRANPNDVDVLYNKSVCLLKLKENVKACETLQKIKALGKPDANDLIKKYCSN